MRYLELPPPERLATWVHCLWAFESSEPGAAPERIVPDGRTELVIHCGEPFHEIGADGATKPQPRALFAGQVTRPLHLRSPGNAMVVGVRFRSAGAKAFVPGSMRQTTDRRISLDELDPGFLWRVVEALAAKPTLEEKAETAGAVVLDRIEQLEVYEDEAVRVCAERIESSGGQVGLASLVASSGLGRRQLERRFATGVGIGPALLASIFRFRSVFDLIEHDATRPWTDAALAAGYYDQSHFIREFRRFVGCTPSEFHRTADGLAAALV